MDNEQNGKCTLQASTQPPTFTNQQLIPIYTSWINRYLLKQQLKPIHDLTYELRDPQTLIEAVHAITFGCSSTSQTALFCCLNASDPVEKIDRCLCYLTKLGVNVKTRAKDLHEGHLGETLALIYALSHYKQQQKSLNLINASPQHIPKFKVDSPKITHANISQVKQTQIPTNSTQKPSSIAKMSSATKLRRPLGSTSSLADTTSVPSKLLAPTRRVSPNVSISTDAQEKTAVIKSPQTRLPSAPPATNRLKPPSITTKLQRPAQSNKPSPNVTSLASSTSSSTSSAASFSSTLATTSGITLTKSQLKPPKSIRPPSVKKVEKPAQVRTSNSAISAPPSKMLKLFGKARKTPDLSSYKDEQVVEITKSPAGIRRSLKPPSGLLIPTTIEKPKNLRPELKLTVPNEDDKSKRNSKSSEEDSGFGNSAAVSLNSSNSSISSGSNTRQQSLPPISHPETIIEASESVADDSGIASDAASSLMSKLPSQQLSNSQQIKPTLAVRAITAPAQRFTSELIKLKPKIESSEEPSTTPASIEKKTDDVSTKSLKKPTVPIRKTSRLQQAEADLDEIPDPPPELKISSAEEQKLRNDALPDSTAAPYVNNEEFALDFSVKSKMPKMKQLGKPPPSATVSKSISIERHDVDGLRRTIRMSSRRRDYVADSCEDSSSISSGISDNNFEDVSTDDLTGSSLSDHQMTTTAGPYGEYRKNTGDIGRSRTSSTITNLEPQRIHQRRIVEQQQNVVEELLQRSRSSQRSVAFSTTPNVNQTEYERVYHTVHVPSSITSPNRFNSGHLLLNQESQTARPSLRTLASNIYPSHHASAASDQSGYNTHSLDRNAHLKQFGVQNERVYDSLNGQVPYRYTVPKPQEQQSIYAAASEYSIGQTPRHHYYSDMIGQNQRRSNVSGGSQLRSASLSSGNSSSLMSRSMILYESDSNLASPLSENNNKSTASLTPRQRLYAEMMAAIKARTPPRSRRAPLFSVANNQRLPNSSLSARHDYAMNLQLHKLSSELNCSPRAQPSMLRMSNTNTTLNGAGSQLSLTSSLGSAYSTSEDAYDIMVRRLNEEMSSCRTKLKNVDKDELHNIIHMFDNKLEKLVKEVEKLQKKSSKANDIESLLNQIEDLRQLSVNARLTVNGQQPTEMSRHPSVESVNSYASTKALKDKNGGFARNAKKGWTSKANTETSQIRNSFSRAFTKSKKSKNGSISECEQSPLHRSNLKPIVGSTTTLDLTDEGLINLKKQLMEKEKQLQETEKQLGNFQLEALDKAREVDILQNTVNRLKNENKFLKHTTIMLEKRAMRTESRASSRQSLSCFQEEEGFYEQTPSVAERSCSSTSSSKRSSGGLNARVVVNVDVSGELEFKQNSQELNIGVISLPSAQTTWAEIDQQLGMLLEEYMRKIDPEMKLTLSSGESSIIGYQLVEGQLRNRLTGLFPTQQPSELITPTTIIRLKLRGALQESMDSLCLESLFPREILQKLINLLLQSHRLVINGSTGIGKSGLARYLGRYLASQKGFGTKQIKNIMFPNDESDQRFGQVQKELENLLKSGEECIVLIDNIHRRRIELICEAFGVADDYYATTSNETVSQPYVIITFNSTSNLQLQQLQLTYNFRAFTLNCDMEPIKGFLGRYLRRRIAQDEFTGQCRCGEQLQCIIEFLAKTLKIVNDFIKDLNALDNTIGPRIFLQCPLSMEQSREWLIKLWNSNIVRYLANIVRESSIDEWQDPTQAVVDIWPWLDGIGGENMLHTVSFELDKPSSRNSSSTSSVGGIDAVYALDRIAESNRVYQTKLKVRP